LRSYGGYALRKVGSCMLGAARNEHVCRVPNLTLKYDHHLNTFFLLCSFCGTIFSFSGVTSAMASKSRACAEVVGGSCA